MVERDSGRGEQLVEEHPYRSFRARFGLSWSLLSLAASSAAVLMSVGFGLSLLPRSRAGRRPPRLRRPRPPFLALFRPRRHPRMRYQQEWMIRCFFATLAVACGYLAWPCAFPTGVALRFASPGEWGTFEGVKLISWVLLGLAVSSALSLVLAEGCRPSRIGASRGALGVGGRPGRRVALAIGSWLALIAAIAAGLAPLAWAVAFAIGGDPAIYLAFERTVVLSSGVSPAWPVLLLAATFLAGIHAGLRRLAMLEGYRVGSPFRGSDDPIVRGIGAEARGLDRLLRGGLAEWLGPGALAASATVAYFLDTILIDRALPTVEGRWFDVAVRLALAVASLALTVGMVHQLRLWSHLRRLLRGLSRLPLEAAYARLPSSYSALFGRYLTHPKAGDALSPPTLDGPLLDAPLRQFRAVVRRLDEGGEALRDALRDRLGEGADEIEATSRRLRELRDASGRAIEDPRRLQAELCRAASVVLGWLTVEWSTHPAAPAVGAGGDDMKGEGETHRTRAAPTAATIGPGPAESESGAVAIAEGTPYGHPVEATGDREAAGGWLRSAEVFVAMMTVPFVSQYTVHLRNAAVSLTAGAVLLVSAMSSYPFQPQRLLLMFGWGLLTSVLAVVLGVLVPIERDEYLSRVVGNTPNRINFDRAFLLTSAQFLVPILVVLAAQFPAISEPIGQLLEPLTRALK